MNIGIIADFNAENLSRLLEKHCVPLGATVTVAPFGQVMQTLLRDSTEFWERPYDLIVLWTSPESVVSAFKDVLELNDWSPDELDRQVDTFVEIVGTLQRRAANVFLPSWVASSGSPHRASIEMRSHTGTGAALLRMNLRLVDGLSNRPGVVLFNTERWLRQGGPGAFSEKLWYLSKTPYSKPVFDTAAKDMAATLKGLAGLRRKVVILDLDNTLWGGIVGDVGWESIRIGGHDPIGEAFKDFQLELKRLSREGVVLAIVSKNEEATALEAVEKHPEMALRATDFAAWRINWSDKANNIADLMADLNLGLDAAVFIDDSPHERDRVRQALPGVLVPDWPSDPMDYIRTLRSLQCFENPVLSSEDRARTAMYVSDRERKALQSETGSIEEWLEMLALEVHVEPLSTSNLDRSSQLLNKTNQMNLTTRRMSSQELTAWASQRNHQVLTFRVRDRVGDYGLCGLASIAFDGSTAELVDCVLSCRAMGRGVEETIVGVVAISVQRAGARKLVASYRPTKKNVPCIRWVEQQHWFRRAAGEATFDIDLDTEIGIPKHIRLTLPAYELR